jgi:hypothetical protein
MSDRVASQPEPPTGCRDYTTTSIYADYAPNPHQAELIERALAPADPGECRVGNTALTVATIWGMTKAELHEQIESMTDEEAAEVKLVFAPDWPSKATSIEEIRKRTGTQAMSREQTEKFWREHGPLMQPADGEG